MLTRLPPDGHGGVVAVPVVAPEGPNDSEGTAEGPVELIELALPRSGRSFGRNAPHAASRPRVSVPAGASDISGLTKEIACMCFSQE